MHPFLALLEQRIVYLDGGFGTTLQAMGLRGGEQPENWNLTHPDAVKSVQQLRNISIMLYPLKKFSAKIQKNIKRAISPIATPVTLIFFNRLSIFLLLPAHGRKHDALLRQLIPVQLSGDLAFFHHIYAITYADHFIHFRRNHQYPVPILCKRI